MSENAYGIPNGFNLGMQPQHHNPNQPQQQPHIPPGVTSPQNGALWNELQQRYANQVQHTQQLNQNATKMLYQSQGPQMQQGLQHNQLANNNPLALQQLRLNPQAAAAVAAARQNQQGGAGLNPGLLGVGAGAAPTGANNNPYNLATGQLSSHFGNQFAALSRAKPDTRIFPSGPNAPPNGPQQQQQQQPGVPAMPGLGLANGGAGNGGAGGPVEALQNQNQNSLLQLAAQGLTAQQFASMPPQQREQLRRLLENQQQQQAFAQAQAQHQLQQQQQQQQQQQPQQAQQQGNQLQFNNGQGQQQSLGAQMPGLGQMGQQSQQAQQPTGFPGGQQPQQQQAQGSSQSNGPDSAAFLESIISLPMEAFRNQLIVLKSKMKALEDQRDSRLQLKTQQGLQEAQKIQAQVHGLHNLMQQLTEAYTRRQAANMGIQPPAAAGPSGQQQQPAAMGPPGGNQAQVQNRPGMAQGPQDGLNAQHPLGWPANMANQQLNRDRLQALANARAAAAAAQQQQQQQQQQQAQPQQQTPQRVPSTQPSQPLHSSPQVNQPTQPGPQGRMQFHEFFTTAFNSWLSQRQLTLDPPRVDGKEVELHKLFLMVGALGGFRAVFEKKLWPVVGAKIGFPYFNGPMPYSKPEVADQLSKIYQKILADFEVHWHNSLRPRDPNSIFPLPQPLQYLHPEIEKLATAQFPLPSQPQQPQRALGAGPQQPPDGGARGPTPTQMPQQTPQMGHTQAAAQQQEAIMRNQPGVAFPPQPGAPGQPAGLPNLPQLQGPLQQLFTNPDLMKLSPEELKRRGLSDDIIQKVLMYRQQLLAAKTIQARKE